MYSRGPNYLPACPAALLPCVQGLIALAEALSLSQHLHEFMVWGNAFGPGSSRAFLDTLQQANLSRLQTDVQPYEVDGRAQVALKGG